MRLLLVALFCILSLPALAETPAEAAIGRAVELVIRPAFAALDHEAEALVGEIDRLCATPSVPALDAARSRFGATVLAHAGAELFRLGPLLEENRAERLLFWPDRKGVALRQVQAILVDEDPAATDPATLAGKSVAVQGFGALEFVLFGTGAEALASADGDYRCRFGAAIARRIAATSNELVAAWAAPDGIAARLVAPDPADPDFRTRREVLEKLVGLMAHGVETVRDQRLLPFLGRDGAAPKPRSALYWRSGLTVPAALANLDSLARLLALSELAGLGGDAGRWAGDSIAFEFRNAVRAGALVPDPPEAAIADERQRAALGYLVLVTQSLGVLLGEQLPAALSLSVGFSSLDGD